MKQAAVPGTGPRARYIAGRTMATAARLMKSTCRRQAERISFRFRARPTSQSAIVVAGSERSGTTWLANAMCVAGVQQVFEPFSAMANCGLSYHFDPDHPRHASAHRWSRLYLRPDADHPDADEMIERVLTGRHRNYWTDILAGTGWPRRYLVKAVHAQMMLGRIASRFGPRVVTVMRHPCAVVASRLRGFGGVFREALIPRMLDQPQLVEDWLDPWVDQLAGEKDPAGRHAAEWAIENAVARSQLATLDHCEVHYEALLLFPDAELSRLSRWLEPSAPEQNRVAGELAAPSSSFCVRRLRRRSHTSFTEYQNVGDRLNRWRRELSVRQQDRVLTWAARFGFDFPSAAAD